MTVLMRDRIETVSYRQLWRYARRIAVGLADLGVEKGEVVSFQLPNWWQFAALHFACLLDYAESEVFIAPKRFPDFDHRAMAEKLRPNLPNLEHIFILDGEGDASFEARFLDRRSEDEPEAALRGGLSAAAASLANERLAAKQHSPANRALRSRSRTLAMTTPLAA